MSDKMPHTKTWFLTPKTWSRWVPGSQLITRPDSRMMSIVDRHAKQQAQQVRRARVAAVKLQAWLATFDADGMKACADTAQHAQGKTFPISAYRECNTYCNLCCDSATRRAKRARTTAVKGTTTQSVTSPFLLLSCSVIAVIDHAFLCMCRMH